MTKKVQIIADEAASLGHLGQIDDAIDKYRAYGVRLILLYQSIGQLKKCFPDGQDQTLLSNVTQVFFGVNDPPTAEFCSQRLGEETIVVESGGTNGGTSIQYGERNQKTYSRSKNWSKNWQQHARKLLKPEEVMALNERTAITFTHGVPPICTTLIRYYERNSSVLRGIRSAIGTFLLSLVFFAVAAIIALPAPNQSRHIPRHVFVPPFPVNEQEGPP